MLAALLISFREVFEAALIVATLLGILTKFEKKNLVKYVWGGTGAATLVSLLLLGLGSLTGVKLHELITKDRMELFEGVVMIVSAVFVTWAVFWLHNTFRKYKVGWLQKLRHTVDHKGEKALFWLVFVAVVREGIEIVLFLSTIYLTESPSRILYGVLGGTILALILSLLLFKTSINLSVYRAFQLTSWLLVLFAAGLLKRGIGELAELNYLSAVLASPEWLLGFIPDKEVNILGGMIYAVSGIGRTISWFQILVYGVYVATMYKLALGKVKVEE